MNEAKELAYKKDEIPAVVTPATAASGDFDFATPALEQRRGLRVATL
ncbi:MAG: hypothetical protein ACYTBX_09085 [Planctomycetota bacterium]